MAAAPRTFPRQYDLQIGPFVTNNGVVTPFATVAMSDLETNFNWVKKHLAPGQEQNFPVGLMFSSGGFLTQSFETPETYTLDGDTVEPGRSLWLVTLVPVSFVGLYSPDVPQHVLDRAQYELKNPGTILYLRFGRAYLLQDAQDNGIVIRAVDRQPGPVDDIVPLHMHGNDPMRTFAPRAHMPSLLSRLGALTNA